MSICLENHPSSSNITGCQVPSHVRVWFHDSADDIAFYQMSYSQSESTILHESIISNNNDYQDYVSFWSQQAKVDIKVP